MCKKLRGEEGELFSPRNFWVKKNTHGLSDKTIHWRLVSSSIGDLNHWLGWLEKKHDQTFGFLGPAGSTDPAIGVPFPLALDQWRGTPDLVYPYIQYLVLKGREVVPSSKLTEMEKTRKHMVSQESFRTLSINGGCSIFAGGYTKPIPYIVLLLW